VLVPTLPQTRLKCPFHSTYPVNYFSEVYRTINIEIFKDKINFLDQSDRSESVVIIIICYPGSLRVAGAVLGDVRSCTTNNFKKNSPRPIAIHQARSYTRLYPIAQCFVLISCEQVGAHNFNYFKTFPLTACSSHRTDEVWSKKLRKIN
jgi:hypothetical protein